MLQEVVYQIVQIGMELLQLLSLLNVLMQMFSKV